MSYFKKNRTDDAFKDTTVYLPKSTYEILQNLSIEKRINISRLVAIAVDNELDCAVPFNYDLTLPTTKFIEFTFIEESAKLLSFFQKLPAGIGLDSVMLARRDIGIPDRAKLLGAVRELLENGLIEKFRYNGRNLRPLDHVQLRMVNPNKKLLKKTRYKRLEGESMKHRRVILDEDVGD
jgi:hypothetical protein